MQGRRAGAGRFRPRGGGWRSERGRLADAFQLHGLHLVGYVDCGWRGALHGLLREAAFLPDVPAAERARANLRLFRGVGGVGVLRVLHSAVTIWTSTYSASFSRSEERRV